MLEGWLDFHRQTLLSKCAGLTAEQLTMRAAAPSNLSLLGLVRHMAEVERGWFRRRVGKQDAGFLYCSDAEHEEDFENAVAAEATRDIAVYQREVELARQAGEGHELDETFMHSHRNVEMTDGATGT
jgi:uncharacterized damage-inducible protein DinB